jgi:hypothetical protein
MTPHDDSFERKIVAALDAGAAGLRAGTAYRLQQARARALARLAQPERATQMRLTPAFAGGNTGIGSAGGGRGVLSRPAFWLSILFAVAMAIGYHQWHAWQQIDELEDVDAAILSSDLPIDAYLDRGFQNWLKTLASDGGS